MNKEKNIIAFGGRKYSGKSMLADIMVKRYHAAVVSCATSLKELVLEMLNADDLEVLNAWKNADTSVYREITSDDIEYLAKMTGIPYENISDECTKIGAWRTVRQMLQFIGTDIIRKYKPTWHVDMLVKKIKNCNADVVVVDDVRFPNEKKAIEGLGGTCFFIIRPTFKHISNHESETALQWTDFTDSRIIINQWPKQTMLQGFYQSFENDFIFSSENQIFLSSHYTYRLMNGMFGMGENDVHLAQSIVSQNQNNPDFIERGIITYETENGDETHEFLQKVCGKPTLKEECKERFSFYNPLILENLKMYSD